MTVRRGGDWGRAGRPPEDLVWFDDDATASEAIVGGRLEFGLRSGDLVTTLGAGPTSPMVEYPLDVVALESEGRASERALSHVVVRRRRLGWWRRPIVFVMNAQHLGRWNVAPRGHPNDGRVEVVTVSEKMPRRQWWSARRRLTTGTHLPHPMIHVSSTDATAVHVPPNSRVDVDGRPWFTTGRHETADVDVRVVGDAVRVWIGSAHDDVPWSP